MKIRDAASIVLVDKSGHEPRILMGRRAAKHKFMPNIYVFPGGRVDYADRFGQVGRDYQNDTLDLLLQQMRGRTTALRAQMMGLAAIRETYEEVGLKIGVEADDVRPTANPSWAAFSKDGLKADLSKLAYIARAITPPGRNRRFDTRFFIADVGSYLDNQKAQSSEELEDVRWVTFKEIEELPLHFITKRILLSAKSALDLPNFGKVQPNVAFYRPKAGSSDVAKMLTELRAGATPLPSTEVQVEKT
ncbi:MAG: NUDIX hydrolase [Hyphomicrobiales bacterium]